MINLVLNIAKVAVMEYNGNINKGERKMANHYSSKFDQRQHMQSTDFEIFYYEDRVLSEVEMHRHNYYEIYFFLEGNVSYQIGKQAYPLSYGDICLIPPGLYHRPIFPDYELPYRRIVLWLSPDYFSRLKDKHPDIFYCFHYSSRIGRYHFSSDFSSAQLVFNKLIEIIEEYQSVSAFHQSMLDCHIATLLLTVSRIVYRRMRPAADSPRTSLFNGLCDYINAHLDEDLSLDALAREFYVSKYHISHIFKENMGISIHQYVMKKRLYASKNGILAGMPLHEVAVTYGFRDYTNFFRAFKKEFGVGPKEFHDTNRLLS